MCLTACNEKTLENEPWKESSKSASEVLMEMNTDLELDFTREYFTKTTYDFYKTFGGEFERKTIEEEKTTSFSIVNTNGISIDSLILENGKKKSRKEQIYNEDSQNIYVKTTIFPENEEDVERVSFDKTENYSTTDLSYLDIYKNLVFRAFPNEIGKVEEKTFDGKDYYKLSATVSNENIGGLDDVNERFKENKDLFNNPNLFEIYEKGVDYVISIDYQYGINRSRYVTYFKIEYSILRALPNNMDGFETYLKVSSTTNLTKIGEEVKDVVEPEDKDIYTASGFINLLKNDNSFVALRKYKEEEENSYDLITVYKSGMDRLFKIEEFSKEAYTPAVYYAYKWEGEGYKTYLISNDTFEETELNQNILSIITIDYNKDFLNKEGSNAYQFGSLDNLLNIVIRENKVYSLTARNTGVLFVEDYAVGVPSPIYDIVNGEVILKS